MRMKRCATLVAIFSISALPGGVAIGQELLESEKLAIDVGGATLHVEVNGDEDSPALLLWGGNQCTTRMWDNTIPRLAEHFRVVRFDVRGTGLSGPSNTEDGYTLEQHADDATKILAALGIEKSAVWSMAWGSRAAVVYASRHAERVTLLTLYDASVGRADVAAQRRGREKALKLQEEAGIPAIPRPDNWNYHKDPETAAKGYGAAGKVEDLPGFLDGITAPTMVCTGDNDPNLVNSRMIAGRVKDAELVVMKDVGHGSVLQRPDLTVDKFLAFAKKHGVID